MDFLLFGRWFIFQPEDSWMLDRSLGGESNQEIVSCRAVRACLRAVWLPIGIGSQKSLPTFPFSLLVSASFPFSLFGVGSFPFSLVWMMCKVYKVYRLYKVCKVYKVYKMFKVCKVWKMFEVYTVDQVSKVFPPIRQTSYPALVGHIGIFLQGLC